MSIVRAPQNKSDLTLAEALLSIESSLLKPIIPELLEWLQDINWPVAEPVSQVLMRIDAIDLIPHLKEVFIKRDEVWTFNCLVRVVDHFQSRDLKLLESDLTQIAYFPTDSEKLDEVDLLAQELLNKIQ